MEIETLIQIFGAAGTTFYVMWLWLQSEKKEKQIVLEKLNQEQEARIKELKEILPLLTETSKGLQEVIKSNTEKHVEVVETIKTHIDTKTNEIIEGCK